MKHEKRKVLQYSRQSETGDFPVRTPSRSLNLKGKHRSPQGPHLTSQTPTHIPVSMKVVSWCVTASLCSQTRLAGLSSRWVKSKATLCKPSGSLLPISLTKHHGIAFGHCKEFIFNPPLILCDFWNLTQGNAPEACLWTKITKFQKEYNLWSVIPKMRIWDFLKPGSYPEQ